MYALACTVIRFSSAPFEPWPDHTEGSSADLGKAIDDIQQQLKEEE